MSLSLEVLQVLAALSAPSPSPSPTLPDPNTMYPKDWWTVGVGITAGLGGAFIGGLAQAWKAKHDERIARNAALWGYHRVLTDISADMSGFMGDTVEGYDDGSYRDRIKDARKAAYPYFDLFQKQDRITLTYPTSNNRHDYRSVQEEQQQIDDAIRVLDGFLAKKRRTKSK